MLDRDLHGDMLKLVRYKILFVKREYEHAFPEQEELVHDNMDGNAFTAWKIAEFIQDLAKQTTTQGQEEINIRVSSRWKNYPPGKNGQTTYIKDGFLTGLPHEDKKFLRVYYEVLDRYPREKFEYEEQQIDVLKEIRDCICHSRSSEYIPPPPPPGEKSPQLAEHTAPPGGRGPQSGEPTPPPGGHGPQQSEPTKQGRRTPKKRR